MMNAIAVSAWALLLFTFERVRIYDSTARWAPPRLVAVGRSGRLVRQGPTPAWLDALIAAGDL